MKRGVDLWLFGLVVFLVAFGVVAVYSASYPSAAADGNQVSLLIRQGVFAAAGLLLMTAVCWMPHRWIRSPALAICLLGLTVSLLIACLVTRFGTQHGRGTDRWLDIGPIAVQPSELAKIALCLFLAGSLDRCRGRLGDLEIYLTRLAVVGFVALLVFKQPHLGATLVILATCGVVLILAGARPRHLLATMLGVAFLVGLSLAQTPYQRARLLAFVNRAEADPSDEGYQAIRCTTALARGGWTGRGAGRSIEKFGYLPECYTDSILAVIGEELGLLGTWTLLALYLAVAYRGLIIAQKLALQADDGFGCYLAVGLSTGLFLQAMLNYWVTTGLAPQTGVGLPFVSYGGSALLGFMGSCGLLLNVSRRVDPKQQPARRAAR